MDTKELLLEFSRKTGVAGLEREAAQYAKSLLEPFGRVHISPLGSVICTVCEPEKDGIHIMLDAHLDEIGMIVTHIGDKGFLRVAACGGVDRRLLLAAAVTVHTERGAVPGVICSIPPHLIGDDENDKKNKKVDDIYIDVGAKDKAEAEAMVQPGDRVTVNADSRELLNNLVSGKAIDDRAGCVSLLKCLEYLGSAPLEWGLSVVFSSMEEVGGQGAKTAAYELNPTHAIAVDVSFAHTPDARRDKCGDLKKGPMIGFAPILAPSVSAVLVRLAEDARIPYQREVMGGRTGTNADQLAACRSGVFTGLVSIPQKYMHTPIETVAVEDVENTGKLLAAFVKTLLAPDGWSGVYWKEARQ